MKYQFRCDKCDKTYDLEIPMDKYDVEKGNQFCPCCKKVLTRVISWEGLAMNLGGYSEIGGIAKWQTNHSVRNLKK